MKSRELKTSLIGCYEMHAETRDEVKRIKNAIRDRVWRILEEKGVALFPKPIKGRIPNFIGAKDAAMKLASLDIWRKSRIIKINPDSPQKWVRLKALLDGKIVIMATPRIRQGFILLDPKAIPKPLYERASSIRGAFQLGRIVGVKELKELDGIDLIVTGSVAVDREGNRLGKGEGYAELEYAILRELGLVDESTPIATTVHDLQIVDYIPSMPYDLKVDVICTPTRIIRVNRRGGRPPGILWEYITQEKIREIPILRELWEARSMRRLDGAEK